MAATPAYNNRASLLAGLRTGGVRSSSAAMPHTAAPGATFNINRYPSQHHTQALVEEDEGQYLEFQSQHAGYANINRGIPMTAAVDGPNFTQLMAQRGLNPNSVPFSPMMNQANNAQNNAFQMQMLQLEMMKIQAAQQMQAEMYAQAQRQQQAQAVQARRPSSGYIPPATAGPHNNSFDLRSAALSAQMRRATEAEQLKSQLGAGAEDAVPMTAALGGRFGSRAMNAPAPMTKAVSGEFSNEPAALPSTPNSTTVISGGTPLGTPTLNGRMAPNATSKSDSVSTWRRGGNNNSVLSGKLRPAAAAPSVTITPPPNEPETQLPSPVTAKSRPIPLRFSGATTQPLAAVAIDTSEECELDETSSSDSAGSNSSPSTPSSTSSNGIPLSPREEASKKLYEGLGIGRPASSNSQSDSSVVTVASYRMVSQPTRQPRGPPSGADELGPKNFATRIRRQAIDGLGFLMNSRERRELVEAF